jgi:NitT/TauT family transport system substrate-binding protein
LAEIKLIASRHSAFYSPLIATIAGGFIEVSSGRIDVGQAAVSASWVFLERGRKPAFANFAQINRFDGFIIASREPDADFRWSKLRGKRFLYVHGGQPEAMLRYGLFRQGIDLGELDGIDSPGGDEMMRQWRDGQGDFFHEQGAFPQQLEHEGIGHIVASVGEALGPVAFSSLVCRWDWLATDEARRFTAAYRAAREWVNTADPGEVARAEARFFPGIAVEATAAAVEHYQKLGTWAGGIEIERDLYERALDVFQHAGMLSKRHRYEEAVVPPPEG